MVNDEGEGKKESIIAKYGQQFIEILIANMLEQDCNSEEYRNTALLA